MFVIAWGLELATAEPVRVGGGPGIWGLLARERAISFCNLDFGGLLGVWNLGFGVCSHASVGLLARELALFASPG
jgi:hypothetical protein